ncbi:hypothetical protein QNI22_36945 [Cytophagaceae bacterium BD1B2-1]|uniref:Uncharacterized protein n=1 Tax=Xanthocytophaga agilis TaxID=3048010 RepID=A0AAE3RD14_9BACT|nr:hypothetical protein [Xanthocytophaga agilis]
MDVLGEKPRTNWEKIHEVMGENTREQGLFNYEYWEKSHEAYS